MLATTYPLLSIFWTMLEFFALIIWIFILFTVVIDLFRSHDVGGGAKAVWLIFILFLPLIGVLVYLIVRGGGMHERQVQQAQAQQKAFDEYVQRAASKAPGTSTADELAKLAELKTNGTITDAEFEAQKSKLLD